MAANRILDSWLPLYAFLMPVTRSAAPQSGQG